MSDEDDEAALARYAGQLADGIEAALPGWVVGAVLKVADAWSPGVAEALDGKAFAAGQRALAEVGPQIRALLATDVDEQSSTPLAIIRSAVSYPTAVLRDAGVPPVVRDAATFERFPSDAYDLTPGSYADLAPDLADLGLLWGAAKAHVVLKRRREIR